MVGLPIGKGVADGCRLDGGSPLDLLSSYQSVLLEQGNKGAVQFCSDR